MFVVDFGAPGVIPRTRPDPVPKADRRAASTGRVMAGLGPRRKGGASRQAPAETPGLHSCDIARAGRCAA